MKWGRPVCISDYGFFFCRIMKFFYSFIHHWKCRIANCMHRKRIRTVGIYIFIKLIAFGHYHIRILQNEKKNMLWCKVMLQSMMMVLGSISVYCSAEFFGALARNLPIIWSFIIMIKQKWYYSGHLSLLNSFNF